MISELLKAVMDAAAAVSVSSAQLSAPLSAAAVLTASLHFEFQNPQPSASCLPIPPPASRSHSHSHSHCKAKAGAGAGARARGTRPFVSPAPPRTALLSTLPPLVLAKGCCRVGCLACWLLLFLVPLRVCRPPLLGTSPVAAAAAVLGERRSGAGWEGPGSGSSRS